uniref:Uncharacterized protein n=1 Tax=Rhizophora mucronata TaxID=61149 RepID=A0A2P2PN68_RHIMU
MWTNPGSIIRMLHFSVCRLPLLLLLFIGRRSMFRSLLPYLFPLTSRNEMMDLYEKENHFSYSIKLRCITAVFQYGDQMLIAKSVTQKLDQLHFCWFKAWRQYSQSKLKFNL